jgi:hypothetical protein
MQENTLNKQDYLDLWKFFSEDTAKIKDKLWTIASWLYALMSGLMAFMLEEKAAEFRPVMGVVGVFLSIYTGYMIQQYGMHVRTGWNVTDFLRTKIEGMEEVWEHRYRPAKADAGGGDGLPGFARNLRWLAVGYGVVFGGMVIWFLVEGWV